MGVVMRNQMDSVLITALRVQFYEENEHSDEELSRWESEQMKKGVSSYKVRS
uniref:Phage protein n=1 Tax=Ascaris lumbricoides TaxID=6252 RepID=A0A0M3HHN6_ASCLU